MAISVISGPEPPAETAPVSGAPSQAWPSPKRAYYTVFVMALVVMFAEVDRGIMSLLVQPIKADMHLSDTSISLLLGVAFALFYAAFGLPTSRFIDRNNRKNLLGAALAMWSVATVFCGLAQNFVQLFLARLFLGAGESVNGPAIFSIISDSFPKERLTRAIALMQLGVTAGGAFSLIMGAVVIHILVGVPDIHLAGVGVIRWWQLVFIVIGLPGLAVAAITAFTVKEPVRRGVLDPALVKKIGMRHVLAYMTEHWRVFAPFMGSMAISSLAMGSLSWGPAFYQRTYGWQPAQIGMVTGLISLFCTPIGLFGGVWLYERYVKKGLVDAPMRVVFLGRLVALPASFLMPLMPSPWLALALSAFSSMALGFTGASQNAALQIITPNEMRGQVNALSMFLFSVVGNGLSPSIVALITDFVFRDESQLRYAMLTTSVLVMPASLFVFWLGIKPFAREVERLNAAVAR
ncbi:MAG: MFS transporter [Caulobacteraceae bacterium]